MQDSVPNICKYSAPVKYVFPRDRVSINPDEVGPSNRE